MIWKHLLSKIYILSKYSRQGMIKKDNPIAQDYKEHFANFPFSMQKLGLVFVAVYQSALKLAYVDRLLEKVKGIFTEEYSPKKYEYSSFEVAFKRELAKAEKAAEIRPNAMNGTHGNIVNGKVSKLDRHSKHNLALPDCIPDTDFTVKLIVDLLARCWA